MSVCDETCCPFVQIRPRGRSIYNQTPDEAWTTRDRQRIVAGMREAGRWQGHRRPLPGKSSEIDHLDKADIARWSAIGSQAVAQGMYDAAATRFPVYDDRRSTDSGGGSLYADDEHRGVCQWPPYGSSAIERAALGSRRAATRARAGILDSDGLFVTSGLGLIAGAAVESPDGRQRLARARAAYTRRWGSGDVRRDMTDREVANYWHGIRCRRLCRTHAAILERRVPSGGITVERMAVPMGCGHRICPECFEESRLVAADRLRGPWTQFLTLTFGHQDGMFLHTWRMMSRWASLMMRAIRRAANKGEAACTCGGKRKGENHPRIRLSGQKFDFGWVIEPHGTMWPHLHVALSTEYLCYVWARKQWARVTGQVVRMIKMKEVTDEDGFCRYLVKYLTKSSFPDILLAVIARRPIWGRSRRYRDTDRSGWVLAERVRMEGVGPQRNVEQLEPDRGLSCVEKGMGVWRVTGKLNGKWIRWVCQEEAPAGRIVRERMNRLCVEYADRSGRSKWKHKELASVETARDVMDLCYRYRKDPRGIPGARRNISAFELDRKGAVRVRRTGSSSADAWKSRGVG